MTKTPEENSSHPEFFLGIGSSLDALFAINVRLMARFVRTIKLVDAQRIATYDQVPRFDQDGLCY